MIQKGHSAASSYGGNKNIPGAVPARGEGNEGKTIAGRRRRSSQPVPRGPLVSAVAGSRGRPSRPGVGAAGAEAGPGSGAGVQQRRTFGSAAVVPGQEFRGAQGRRDYRGAAGGRHPPVG